MSQFSHAHDRLLRGIIKSTGLTLGDWFKVLDGAGIRKSGFLAGLEFLRDEKKLSHDEATALAWSFLNPDVVPADLAKSLEGGGPKPPSEDLYTLSDNDEGDEIQEITTVVTRSVTRSSSATGNVGKNRPAKSAKARPPANAPMKRASAKPPASKKAAPKKAARKKAAPKKAARKKAAPKKAARKKAAPKKVARKKAARRR